MDQVVASVEVNQHIGEHRCAVWAVSEANVIILADAASIICTFYTLRVLECLVGLCKELAL